MSSTGCTALAPLPQHFDAALLAKFYRSMYATATLNSVVARAFKYTRNCNKRCFRTRLLDDCVPFWFPRCVDRQAPSFQDQNPKPVCVF